MSDKPQVPEISSSRTSIARLGRLVPGATAVFAIGMLFLVLATTVWFSADVLLLLFACILFAVLLYDMTARVRGWLNLPHVWALTVVVFGLMSVFGVAGWLMAPQISMQANELATTVPQSITNMRKLIESHEILRLLTGGLPTAEKLSAHLEAMLPQAGLFFSGVLGVVGNALIIIFVGIYLAAQPGVYIEGAISLVPPRRRARAREVADEIGRTLGQWLVGKTVSMLIVGIITAGGLMLLGVPLALVLGIIAGLLDFIPYVGPIIAGVPAVLIAFAENPTLAWYVILLFFGIQMTEGYLLQPLIESKSVSMPPGLTIAMQVLLGAMFGLAGVALATPLTAVLAVLVVMLYVQDVLGDHVRTPSEAAGEPDACDPLTEECAAPKISGKSAS